MNYFQFRSVLSGFSKALALSPLLLLWQGLVATEPVHPPMPVSRPSSPGPLAVSSITINGNAVAVNSSLDPGSVSLSLSGGTAPYRIVWSNRPVPTYREAMQQLYADLKGPGDTLVVDSVSIQRDLLTLGSVTTNTNLPPGLYYARVIDATGATADAGAAVGRPMNWFVSGGMTYRQISSTRAIINGTTWLPATCGLFTNNASSGPVYAISQEFLYPEDYQYIDFQAPPISARVRSGFSIVNTSAPGTVTDMRYHLDMSAGTASLVVSGTVRFTMTYTASDMIGMEVRGQQLYLYKNYQLISTPNISITGGIGYQYQTILDRPLDQLNGLKVITIKGGTASLDPNSPAVWARSNVGVTVFDATCANPCGASISATASIFDPILIGSPGPVPQSFKLYTVSGGFPSGSPIAQVNTTSSFAASFGSLCAGDYMIRFTYTSSGNTNTLQTYFSVAYMPDWTGVTNVSVNSGDRSLLSGSISSCIAGAFSENEMDASTAAVDWFEFGAIPGYSTVPPFPTPSLECAAGLSNMTSSISATSIENINYGIRFKLVGMSNWPPGPLFNPGGWFYAYTSNGTSVSAYMGYGYADADRFKISKSGTAISFYRNNAVVPSTTVTPVTSTGYLRCDASMCSKSAYLVKPRISFTCPLPPSYAVLRKQRDGQCYRTQKNQLYFKYDEDYADTDQKLRYTIYNAWNDAVINSASLPTSLVPAVAYGDNRYMIDLANTSLSGGQTLAPGYYLLEVVNEKNESWYLRFKK